MNRATARTELLTVVARRKMLLCRYLCMLILAIAGASCASATTILVLFTPQAVFVGSDSQLSRLDGSEARPTCKIHITKEFVWASAGLALETNGPFDIRTLVGNSLAEGLPFSQAVDRLEAALKRDVPGVLERLSASGENARKAQITVAVASTKSLGQVSQIFVAADSFKRSDCPAISCGQLGVFELGEHAAVDEILDKRHAIWKEMGILNAMNFLITAQEHKTPRFVSGPIAVLQIDASGTRWLEKGACKPN